MFDLAHYLCLLECLATASANIPAVSHHASGPINISFLLFFFPFDLISTRVSVLELTHHLLCFNKQRLLVSHIEERLRSLEEMQAPLQTEVEQNAAHGEALELLVRERCLPVELERYKLFIGDLERVVNLLLCLSARLARVQNALSTVDQHTDAEEKVRNVSV